MLPIALITAIPGSATLPSNHKVTGEVLVGLLGMELVRREAAQKWERLQPRCRTAPVCLPVKSSNPWNSSPFLCFHLPATQRIAPRQTHTPVLPKHANQWACGLVAQRWESGGWPALLSPGPNRGLCRWLGSRTRAFTRCQGGETEMEVALTLCSSQTDH